MGREVAPATPRRSKRGQPAIIPLEDDEKRPVQTLNPNEWADDAHITTRTYLPALDHDDRDKDISAGSEDLYEVDFYSAFSRAMNKTNARRKRGRPSGDGTYFQVGDTVLVRTQRKEPSIAVIISMWEVKPTEDAPDVNTYELNRMKVRVRWFLRPSELPGIRGGKERGYASNELYFTLASHDILSPASIESRCRVSGDPADRDSEEQDVFFCNTAIENRRVIYYYLDWADHHERALSSRDSNCKSFAEWDVSVLEPKRHKKSDNGHGRGGRRSKRHLLSDSSDSSDSEGSVASEGADSESDGASDEMDIEEDNEEEEEEEDVVMDEPRTPRKRKQPQTTTTPRRRKQPIKAKPTPHSRRTLLKRNASKGRGPKIYKKLEFDIQGGDDADVATLPPDLWRRSMHTLHIGNRPRGAALPCREDEFEQILSGLQGILEEDTGGCIYVSGVPGTGKTATVHAVVRQLKLMAEENETVPFTYVEINGLKLTDPTAAYSLLWESLLGYDENGDPATKKMKNNKDALKSLTSYFSGKGRGPVDHACVVLMDELDQLMTTNQDVIYNFFNWPMLASSRLIVLAVANTMDLPERVMTGRVRSRLGMVRINFQPYTTKQLEQIISARLTTAKESFEEGHKARNQEVISDAAIKLAAMKTSSVSGDARRVLDVCRRAIELCLPTQATAKPSHIGEIITGIQSTPACIYVSSCTFHQRVMLAAILKCIKKTGIEQVKWDDVYDQHHTYASTLNKSTHYQKPTSTELLTVLNSLVSSRAILIERDKTMVGKDIGARKVMLNMDPTDIERELSKENINWRNLFLRL